MDKKLGDNVSLPTREKSIYIDEVYIIALIIGKITRKY